MEAKTYIKIDLEFLKGLDNGKELEKELEHLMAKILGSTYRGKFVLGVVDWSTE